MSERVLKLIRQLWAVIVQLNVNNVCKQVIVLSRALYYIMKFFAHFHYLLVLGTKHQQHKFRTYKEYHSVRPSSELGLSQPLSRQRVFPSPQKQGGGGTLACGWGVGGSPNSNEGHTLWYSLHVRTL